MIVEQLFGSSTRWRLLWLFLQHPEERYFVRQLARETESHMHAVRREISHLCELGIIHEVEGSLDIFESEGQQAKKKYYCLNPGFVMLDELKALFLKDGLMGQKDFIDKIEKLGKVDYLLLSGTFTGAEDADIDMLLVGSIPKDKLEKMCADYERRFDKQLRYSVMNEKEFLYRKDVVDRFLYQIFDHKHVIVKDAINKK